MASVVLIIDYLPSAGQRQAPPDAMRSVAEHIVAIEGLAWKYWLVSRDDDKHGGVYLFQSSDLAQRGGDQLKASLEEAGATDIALRFYDVDADLTAITNGSLP